MKQWFLALLSFLGLSHTTAGTLPVVPVYPKQNSFTFVLRANPTTGYQWSVESYDKSVLKFVKMRYFPRDPSTHLLGASGAMKVTFACLPQAARPKETEVVMRYARPWEKDKGELTQVRVIFMKNPSAQ